MRHGGKVLIDQLAIQGVQTIFTVPGESFLAALDALFDESRIRTIACRHEGGAAMMAEATAKLTGRPGVAFVTRGPGAANAVSGVFIAQHDSTPMILLVGLPPRANEGRGAFQSVDIEKLFSPIAKWTAVVRTSKRIPEYLSRAFHTAMVGRPGLVVIGLPEDVLMETVDVPDAEPASVARPAASAGDVAQLRTRLGEAERPIMIVGGPGWSAETRAGIEAFGGRFDLPVAAAFRRQDYIDNRHPSYVGHAGLATDAKLAAAIRSADLLLVIGARLGDTTTGGYTLVGLPEPRPFLVHVHPSADELGRLYCPDLPIVATVENFAAALAGLEAPRRKRWARLRRDLRGAYEATLVSLPTPGGVKLEEVVRVVSDELPEDGIVTNGAGNYAAFVHRYFCYKTYPSQLAPTSGSMGYGLPAAIAAKHTHPDRPVVAFAGDGCFLMTAQELATAVQYALPIVVVVANNGMYGTIRMQQEEQFPDRVVATSLVNPDFAAFARSFGAAAETITETADFRPAFRRALRCERPTVIELKIDPEAIMPGATLSELRGRRAGQ